MKGSVSPFFSKAYCSEFKMQEQQVTAAPPHTSGTETQLYSSDEVEDLELNFMTNYYETAKILSLVFLYELNTQFINVAKGVKHWVEFFMSYAKLGFH
ncbi:hypothetical protein Nepgr_029755 [Nepenthes gracilis]|uniref:Uncharacterized protein n=1 Tax=Nepenthes gracilis TaxID=150966 RepID=A0AAD3Y3A3_NEPGR|nr:hypothetical protein Nepgr_029755 [Nepenthes gracilis]